MAQPLPLRPAKPSIPASLAEGPEGELYATLVRSYGLRDAASLAILTEALTSLKIARECHEQIARDGRTGIWLLEHRGCIRFAPSKGMRGALFWLACGR
jgi:hypothetical protein